MPREIARRLVGGIWRTVDADEAAGGGGSQPITSPLDITGCALWLDASQLALADNAPVALLPDLSPSGFDAVQAVANNQPVCKTAIQNGLRVVRFDPTTHIQFLALSGAGLGLFRDLTSWTIAAASGNAVADADWWFEAASSDGMGERAASQIINIVASNDDTNTVSICPIINSGRTASFYCMVGSADFTNVQLIAQMSCGVGIAAQNSDTTTFIAGSATPNTASAGIYLGQNATADTGAQCDMGEVAVWQRALNATERRQVLEYLSAKWATP